MKRRVPIHNKTRHSTVWGYISWKVLEYAQFQYHIHLNEYYMKYAAHSVLILGFYNILPIFQCKCNVMCCKGYCCGTRCRGAPFFFTNRDLPKVDLGQRWHYSAVIMSTITSQITIVSSVWSTVCSGPDQRKHQSSASLAFVRDIHWWPVNSPHKWPVTRKMSPFDNIIMEVHYFLCYMIIHPCFNFNGGFDRR